MPEAVAADVGLCGFAKPGGAGTIGLDRILPRQICELSGDQQTIAVLARVYHGASLDAMWVDGKFVEPDTRPPLRIRFKRRRGFQDTARIEFDLQVTATRSRPAFRTCHLAKTTGPDQPAVGARALARHFSCCLTANASRRRSTRRGICRLPHRLARFAAEPAPC